MPITNIKIIDDGTFEEEDIDLCPESKFQFENSSSRKVRVTLPEFTFDPASSKVVRNVVLEAGQTSQEFQVRETVEFKVKPLGPGSSILRTRTTRININF